MSVWQVYRWIYCILSNNFQHLGREEGRHLQTLQSTNRSISLLKVGQTLQTLKYCILCCSSPGSWPLDWFLTRNSLLLGWRLTCGGSCLPLERQQNEDQDIKTRLFDHLQTKKLSVGMVSMVSIVCFAGWIFTSILHFRCQERRVNIQNTFTPGLF